MKRLLPYGINLLSLSLVLFSYLSFGQDKPRPQEPKAPFPYISEDVTFQNENAGIELAGTLTIPKGANNVPAIILISGSSPHNRNQEVAGHKTFLVLSDYLTRQGFAVLRYDDRGVGGSEGTYDIAAYDDRTSDAVSAFTYLQSRSEISKKNIGIIGHSEGGLIAPLVAMKQEGLQFIVMLGASTLPGHDIILLQTESSNEAKGINPKEIAREVAFLKLVFQSTKGGVDTAQAKTTILAGLEEQPNLKPEDFTEESLDGMLQTLTTDWFQRLLWYDPAQTLAQVNCSVLALYGEKDRQILPKQNLAAAQNAISQSGNIQSEAKELAGLNHLFQEAITGQEDEFATIEQTISPIALKEITEFIKYTIN